LPTRWAQLAGGVVDDELLLDAESGGESERVEFLIGEDVAPSSALRLFDVPNHGDVAIRFVPGHLIAEKAQSCWQRSKVARVVAVIHVDEDPALRSQQTPKLAEHFDSGTSGEDVAEDIPKAGDDVKLPLNRVQFFSAHGPNCGVRGGAALHRAAWLEQHKFLDTSCLRDAAGASSIATPDVEHRAAAGRDRGKNQPIDTIQIRFSLLRQTRKNRRDTIVGDDGIDASIGLDLLRLNIVGLTHSLLSMEPR